MRQLRRGGAGRRRREPESGGPLKGEQLRALSRPCSTESFFRVRPAGAGSAHKSSLGGRDTRPTRKTITLFWEPDNASLRARRPNALKKCAPIGAEATGDRYSFSVKPP